MDGVGAKYPHSQAILEFWASVHNELNRESQYFEVLIKLFDVYLTSGNVKKAAESLERLVDIDAYDFRNQERMELLRGKVEDAQLKRIASRLLKSSTPTPGHASHAPHAQAPDRKSTRLNSSHSQISYAVFCLENKHSLPRHRLTS